MRPGLHKARGIALVTAMIVAFSALTLAMGLTVRQQRDIYRTDAILRASEAGVRLAEIEMAALLAMSKGPIESGAWAAPRRPLETLADDARTEGRATLEDLQRYFNLNALRTEGEEAVLAMERLGRLLDEVGLDGGLAAALADWVDGDSVRRADGGAEDDVYTRLDAPYRSGNTAVARLSELRLVRGVDEDVLRLLSGHVAALPVSAKMNVNTISPLLLQTLHPEITPVIAAKVVHRREQEPFDSLESFAAFLERDGISVVTDGLTTRSRVFLLRAWVKLDGREHARSTVFELRSDGYDIRGRFDLQVAT